MAAKVYNSGHPIAGAALEMNTLTFHLAVEMWEAQRDAAAVSSQEPSAVPRAELEQRLEAARNKHRQVRERLERLRADDARTNKPVSGKRKA